VSTRGRVRRYRQVDAALIRATAHPGELEIPPWPETEGDAAVEQGCAWLAQVWAQHFVAEAVAVASPVLAARIEAVRAGQRPPAGQVRRMVMALARYLVRMRGRATPFGVFAGVAPVRFGPEPSLTWTGGHYVRSRADAVWLAEVISRLEACPALRRRLPVVVNDLAFLRGERLIVPWQPHADDPGRNLPAEVSVRYGKAVRVIVEAARCPISVGDLIDKLAAEIPGASGSTIDDMLAELIACGVMVTALRPPSTVTDGLAHVLTRLRDVQADELEDVAPLVEELRAIHAHMDAANQAMGRIDGRIRRVAADRMRTLPTAVVQPLMVDLRLGCTVVLPRQVAVEAETAAEVLLRLAPDSAGKTAWRDYHTRFLERYSAGALVPVDQLVDPVTGLGFPAHYMDPVPAVSALMSSRDERLLVLAQQAALDGAREIVLDETTLETLAAEGIDQMQPVPHAALCVEVRAASMTALAEGAFTLLVTGTGRTAAALSGRFLDLMAEKDQQRMTEVYRRLPTGVDGAVAAQLSFPPRSGRMANVVRAPSLLPDVISVAEHRDNTRGRVLVKDLAVTADNDRMFLVSLPERRVVEPMLASAAALRVLPPLARLLFEIPRAGKTAVSPFAWGAAGCLPFLPRLRYGRTVLARARWRVPIGELPGPQAPHSAWVAAMAAVRERRRLPDVVQVGEADRRLRLSLDEPMDLALLRAHLNASGAVATFWEASTAADHGWLGRAHEIVIPLATTASPAPAPAAVIAPGPLPMIDHKHALLPGSSVLFAKVYAHLDVVDTILVQDLPALLSAWDGEPQPMWWFIRYRDPDPHLRLRLNLVGRADYGQAAARVGAWAADLRWRGLIGDLVLDTYHPETARYGSGATLTAAEELFAADSVAVLTQLTALTTSRAIDPHALTAASLVDLTVAMTGSWSAGLLWLIDHAPAGPATSSARDVVRQATALIDPVKNNATLRALAGGAEIADAWEKRHRAATVYAGHLAADHMRLDPVLASLLHMHHVRAHGISPEDERVCRRLARAVALAWTVRRAASRQGDDR
jgi:thiopeptide-type bacteriocin biosynthesis protein